MIRLEHEEVASGITSVDKMLDKIPTIIRRAMLHFDKSFGTNIISVTCEMKPLPVQWCLYRTIIHLEE